MYDVYKGRILSPYISSDVDMIAELSPENPSFTGFSREFGTGLLGLTTDFGTPVDIISTVDSICWYVDLASNIVVIEEPLAPTAVIVNDVSYATSYFTTTGGYNVFAFHGSQLFFDGSSYKIEIIF